MKKYNKRFSVAHFDRFHGDQEKTFYTLMSNASQTYIDNIHDVYFGKFFYYQYNGMQKKFGNAMGVEASDEQINWLFKLQEERGIEISLTINSLEIPHEVAFDTDIRNQFVEWIGGYYDRGLRSCTMSSEHIMRTGLLQQRCPDMRWKSTVNQICADAQQLIDLAYLGYNSINLDRSLNRNIKELRRIKKAQDYLNSLNPKKKLVTILLIAEACIYRCPFKREHDSVGEHIGTEYFKDIANMSCNAWRSVPEFAKSPRSGVNIVANDVSTFEKYAELVDVFKFSGRFTVPTNTAENAKYLKACWFYEPELGKFKQAVSESGKTIYADDYNEIIENNLGPIHDWIPGWIDTRYTKENWRTTYKPYNGIWSTEPGKKLEKLLLSCRSQCWDCHECEDVFGMQRVDSALQMRKEFKIHVAK